MTPLLTWSQAPRVVPGHAYGFATGHVVLKLACAAGWPAVGQRLHARGESVAAWLAARDGALTFDVASIDFHDSRAVLSGLLNGLVTVQMAAGMPAVQRGRVLRMGDTECVLALPTPTQNPAAVPAALLVVNELLSADDAAGDAAVTGAFAQLEALAPKGMNPGRLMTAALTLGLPRQHLGAGLLQVGVGVNARWFASTLTDCTSALGTSLARNKLAGAQFLRAAGLPVADHVAVSSEAEALKAAARLGYPLVVKPANLDGGVGVMTGLRSDAALLTAYRAAVRHSSAVLVERHVAGRDYRLTVINGELLWAVERQPGGVTGDGVSTLEALLNRLNSDPRRGTAVRSVLKVLKWDEEAKNLAAERGMRADSVPAEGQFVPLRSAANVSSGGMPVAVMAQVHPDNRDLAIRAARVLRLDLAGIDLLMPDIARSWHEGGAVICEVNAQPQLGAATGTWFCDAVLQRTVPHGGRIPTVVVLGADRAAQVAQTLAASVHCPFGGLAAYTLDGKPWLGAECLAPAPVTPYLQGRYWAGDRQAGAMILEVNDLSLLETGLPFDRIDALYVAGGRVHLPNGMPAERARPAFAQLLRVLVAATTGPVVLAPEAAGVKTALAAFGIAEARVLTASDVPTLRQHLHAVLPSA